MVHGVHEILHITNLRVDMSRSYVRVINCDKQGRRRTERQRMSKNSIR